MMELKKRIIRGIRYWQILGLVSASLLIYMCLPFLDAIIYGIFLYYVARPLYVIIHRRVHHDTIGAFVALFAIILPIILILLYTLSVAFNEFSTLLSSADISIEYLNEIIYKYGALARNLEPHEIMDLFVRNSGLGDSFFIPITLIVGVILKLFIMLTTAFYLLKDGSRLREWIVRITFGKGNALANKFLNATDESLHMVFFGSIITAIVTAVDGMLVYTLLNQIAPPGMRIPYEVLMGILSGMATLIPGIGIKFVWVPLLGYLGLQGYLAGTLASSFWFLLLFFVVVNIIVDFMPDIILRPYVSGKDVHKGMIMLAFIFGPLVFGIKGIFLGPIILILVTEFMKHVLPEIR
ncbi:MAG: AI-2E family transporter, partial [Candidatus Altiarchaeota archaeon]|nr:AI-2E family transporter [Candidatus Altiarchaeota archaeon]